MALCFVLLFDATRIALSKQFNNTYKMVQYISVPVTYRQLCY